VSDDVRQRHQYAMRMLAAAGRLQRAREPHSAAKGIKPSSEITSHHIEVTGDDDDDGLSRSNDSALKASTSKALPTALFLHNCAANAYMRSRPVDRLQRSASAGRGGSPLKTDRQRKRLKSLSDAAHATLRAVSVDDHLHHTSPAPVLVQRAALACTLQLQERLIRDQRTLLFLLDTARAQRDDIERMYGGMANAFLRATNNTQRLRREVDRWQARVHCKAGRHPLALSLAQRRVHPDRASNAARAGELWHHSHQLTLREHALGMCRCVGNILRPRSWKRLFMRAIHIGAAWAAWKYLRWYKAPPRPIKWKEMRLNFFTHNGQVVQGHWCWPVHAEGHGRMESAFSTIHFGTAHAPVQVSQQLQASALNSKGIGSLGP
jgi:hypothetical protein